MAVSLVTIPLCRTNQAAQTKPHKPSRTKPRCGRHRLGVKSRSQGRRARDSGRGSLTMRTPDLLADAFGRVHYEVHQCVDGLGPDLLAVRPDGAANSIAWL